MKHYRPSSGRGKAGMSREIGAEIMRDVTIHDDGMSHFGGISACVTGPMGCGKTTFLLQLAQSVGSLTNGKSKENYTASTPLMPETVIWRGRQLDYWNTLTPNNWCKSFPQTPLKRQVCVHVFENDDEKLRFFEDRIPSREVVFDGNNLGYLTYSTASDLYSNLIKGGINVVYEPTVYYLQTDIVEELVKRTLYDLRLKRLKKETKKKKKEEDADADPNISLMHEGRDVQAPSGIFWYELLEELVKRKPQREYVSIFIDEAHQVIPMTPPGEFWHLLALFGNSMIDFRRKNISIFFSTHDTKHLDYRVTERILYYFWMPGSRTYPRVSMLDPPITRIIDKGEVIPELSNRKWGYSQFDAIPHQPPLIRVEGMPAST